MSEGRDKLVKVLGMLGSAHDGEVLAAARMLDRMVRGNGATWDQLIIDPSRQNDQQQPPPPPEPKSPFDFNKDPIDRTVEDYIEALAEVEEHYLRMLTVWEQGFVPSALAQARAFGSLSDKQMACADRIFARVGISAGFAEV